MRFLSSLALSYRARQKGGAVLAVIAGLLVVAASILAIRMARQVEARTQQQQLTQTRMLRIQAALHAFAASQGRLPCPANGAQDTGLAVPAVAVVTCTNRNGAVPWVSLGLQADDALDGWGRKISYRVPDGPNGLTNTGSIGSPGTVGLSVNDAGAPKPQQAWVLISHGASGLGAWRVALPRMALPGAGGKEWDHSQLPLPPTFWRWGETLVNPVSGMDYALTDVAHFDDVLWFESIADLKTRSNHEQVTVRLTTARLDSITPVAYDDRNTKIASITFDSATAWGNMTVASTGGNISRNADGTGIGVCSGACNDDATAALDASKKLAFKLDVGKTAQKFSIGILSIEPTVEFLLTFKNGGIPVGSSVRVPLPPPPPALPDPPPPKPVELGKLVKFDYLQPNPPGSFNEVEIQPLGTSRFFIASIRFCTAAENCN